MIELFKINDEGMLETLRTIHLFETHSQICKFLSPKELYVSTYGDGFTVYHVDYLKHRPPILDHDSEDSE